MVISEFMSMGSDDSLKAGIKRIMSEDRKCKIFESESKSYELWIWVNIKNFSVLVLRIILCKAISSLVHRDFEWRIRNNMQWKWGFYF